MHEARCVQIDFGAAVHMVNHQRILFNLCSVGVGGSVLSVQTQFLSNWHSMLWWMVVGANKFTWCQQCLREVFPELGLSP